MTVRSSTLRYRGEATLVRHLADDRVHDAYDAVALDDAAVLPPVPGLAVDRQPSARFGHRDALLDQPAEYLLLLHHRLSSWTTP